MIVSADDASAKYVAAKARDDESPTRHGWIAGQRTSIDDSHMANLPETDLAKELTGLCTFLVQGQPFEPGDEIELVVARSAADDDETGWMPLTATRPEESRDALTPGERAWGSDVVLVRARLARTGGFPRDSMNRPSDSYDPAALTLSDVRIIDRWSKTDGAGSAAGDSTD